MVHIRLAIVNMFTLSALAITKNPLLLFSHPQCVLVHSMGSGEHLCYSSHVVLTTTKAVEAALTRLRTKSFKNFCLPVTKIEIPHQKVLSRILT